MVESERPAAVPGVGDDRGPGVVGGLRLSAGPGDEDRRDGVEARVPGRVGVSAELAEKLDVERGLLAGLPDRGRLEGLAVVDETARQGPARRRVLALDEDDAPALPAVPKLDDDVDRGHGVAESPAGHSLFALPGPL